MDAAGGPLSGEALPPPSAIDASCPGGWDEEEPQPSTMQPHRATVANRPRSTTDNHYPRRDPCTTIGPAAGPPSRRAANSAAARESRRRAVRAERSTGAAGRVERPRIADAVFVATTGARRAAWPANTGVECRRLPHPARFSCPRAVRARRATDAAGGVGAPHVADVVRAAAGAPCRAASRAATRAPAAARAPAARAAAHRAAARPSARRCVPPARCPAAAARAGVVAHRAGAARVVRCVGANLGNGHLASAGGCHEHDESENPQRSYATKAVLAGPHARAGIRSRHGTQNACSATRPRAWLEDRPSKRNPSTPGPTASPSQGRSTSG